MKFILERPSQVQGVSRFLRDRLYLNKDREVDYAIMVDAGLLKAPKRKPQLRVSDYCGQGGYSDTIDGRRVERQQFFGRVWAALFGGVVIVGPMLIITLHGGLVTQLVTTSVFVLFIGLVLAWFMEDASQKDIVTATAAYAAVLVVFVGTTS